MSKVVMTFIKFKLIVGKLLVIKEEDPLVLEEDFHDWYILYKASWQYKIGASAQCKHVREWANNHFVDVTLDTHSWCLKSKYVPEEKSGVRCEVCGEDIGIGGAEYAEPDDVNVVCINHRCYAKTFIHSNLILK